MNKRRFHNINGVSASTLIFILTALLLIPIRVLPAIGLEKKKKENWKTKLPDRTTITKEDLPKILEEHKKWFNTDGKEGKRANLSGAVLLGADLNGANLIKANLSGAALIKADLSKADLSKADLNGANLSGANLSGAFLNEANLRGAALIEANLMKTYASFVDFSGSYFQPENIEGLIFLGAKGLSSIIFVDFKAVVDLRKIAKESGLRNEERALTAALRKYRLKATPLHERIFEYTFLDLPTDSGANPWRSLEVLGLLIIVFSIPYMIALWTKGQDGIWKIWIPGRMRKDLGEKEPMRLTFRGFTALRVGFYFSVLSAFSIGWRELNVGNWIARMQWREYTLRASGWPRTVSGVQSLISVYLVALWVITYFGRPFE
jgi:uncharacterized protein YjbI with pentapeptide repeats